MSHDSKAHFCCETMRSIEEGVYIEKTSLPEYCIHCTPFFCVLSLCGTVDVCTNCNPDLAIPQDEAKSGLLNFIPFL